jgi:polyhydroxyalkanoate synthesis regulator phasin
VTPPLIAALIKQLVRNGALDADDIDEMATRLEQSGHPDEARACMAAFVQASAPSQAEWEAQQRRSRMQVVPDGGNQPD